MKTRFTIISTDDDRDDQEFLIEAIKETKVECDVICASNGIQLIDILTKKNQYEDNCSKLPDLIILDLNMPLMDGYEVLKIVKGDKNLKDIPICVLTTSHHESDKIKSINYGANGFYSKPMSATGLQKIVKEIFSNYLGVMIA
jgi:CheY-like chemotaxis protein